MEAIIPFVAAPTVLPPGCATVKLTLEKRVLEHEHDATGWFTPSLKITNVAPGYVIYTVFTRYKRTKTVVDYRDRSRDVNTEQWWTTTGAGPDSITTFKKDSYTDDEELVEQRTEIQSIEDIVVILAREDDSVPVVLYGSGIGGGTVNPKYSVNYGLVGESVTFNVSAIEKNGYTFSRWTGDGTIASPRNPNTSVTIPVTNAGFSNIHNVYAYFRPNVAPPPPGSGGGGKYDPDDPYLNQRAFIRLITYPEYSICGSTTPDNEMYSGDPGGQIQLGASVTVNQGWEFKGWYRNGVTLVSTDLNYEFAETFPANGATKTVTLVAKFKVSTIQVTTETIPEIEITQQGMIASPDGVKEFIGNPGSTLTVRRTYNNISGSWFAAQWKLDGNVVATRGSARAVNDLTTTYSTTFTFPDDGQIEEHTIQLVCVKRMEIKVGSVTSKPGPYQLYGQWDVHRDEGWPPPGCTSLNITCPTEDGLFNFAYRNGYVWNLSYLSQFYVSFSLDSTYSFVGYYKSIEGYSYPIGWHEKCYVSSFVFSIQSYQDETIELFLCLLYHNGLILTNPECTEVLTIDEDMMTAE